MRREPSADADRVVFWSIGQRGIPGHPVVHAGNRKDRISEGGVTGKPEIRVAFVLRVCHRQTGYSQGAEEVRLSCIYRTKDIFIAAEIESQRA